MVQDIITAAMVMASAGYMVYNLYAMVFLSKKKLTSRCTGCAGCEQKIRYKTVIKT